MDGDHYHRSNDCAAPDTGRCVDSHVSERRRHCSTGGRYVALWTGISGHYCVGTSGLYDGTGICQYTEGVWRDYAADESRCCCSSCKSVFQLYAYLRNAVFPETGCKRCSACYGDLTICGSSDRHGMDTQTSCETCLCGRTVPHHAGSGCYDKENPDPGYAAAFE